MARKILLADDSVTAQNMGRKILADAGYEVITVNNGSAALKKIAEAKPDVIVLDVYMPGYSGLEVCQRLKEAQETSRIPILLTVGKLEPFKPEEAKRVKAEGFIVKPFEASELLAALTKLEDKIVPRPETTKPGRFARANAAIEETRYGVPADEEEDSGWKERIRFPSKAKKAEPEPEAEESLYNPVNKDLRTTVEQRRPTSPHAVPYEQSRVDLGALVPEGLPKDVTPEEIAALAAAAAQVKARVEESQAERAQESLTPPKASAPKPEAHPFDEKLADQPVATPVAETMAPEKVAEKPVEAVAPESKADLAAEAAPIATAATAGASEQPASGATFAVREAEESAPAEAEKLSAVAEIPEVASPKPADAVASSEDSAKVQEPEPKNQPTVAEMPAEKPITMAVAAGAEYLATPSRWQAVAVAISPEESSASLELEMARELAKVAQAAAAPAIVASPEPIPAPEPAVPVESASIVEPVVPEIFSPAAASPEPTPSCAEPQAVTIVPAEPAFETAPAVKQFEKVSLSHDAASQVSVESLATPQTATQVEDHAVPAPALEAQADTPAPLQQEEPPVADEPVLPQPVAETAPEIPHQASEVEPARLESPRSEPETVAAIETSVPVTETEAASPVEERSIEEQPVTSAEVSASARQPQTSIETARNPEAELAVSEITPQPDPSEKPIVEAAAVSAPVVEAVIPAPSPAEDASEPFSSAPEPALAATTASIESPASSPKPEEPVASGFADIAKKESEIAATTAAAWASWRRIRETDHRPASEEPVAPKAEPKHESAAPSDTNAMAVAAGAEKAAEEPAEIENIVDSVLADLRPKIVAEISKKLGKKK